MVHCKCGRPMEKVPDWMQSVQVEFLCNNCPNRKTKNIAFLSLEQDAAVAARLEVKDEPVEVEPVAKEDENDA